MNRLVAGLRWNVVLQFRNGFYFASAFFALLFLGLLSQIPRDGSIDLGLVVPAFMALNLLVTCFYFIAGLVMLEKAEGSLSALVVTPLRGGEYLSAKAVTLTALGLAESLLIALPLLDRSFAPLPLLLGVCTLGGMYVFLGFVTIERFGSITDFLLPSGLLVALLVLPLVDFLGLFQNPLFYLHPLYPALALMRAAFNAASPGEVAYGVIGSLAWLGISFWLARRAFGRFAARAV